MDVITQGLSYSYLLFLHLFRMMYWVWIPGFLLSAFFSLRYKETARTHLISRGGLSAALLYGIATSPSRKKALEAAQELRQNGVGREEVLVFLIASQNLVIYFLVFLMALMGAEFALGQLMGGLIMAFLVGSAWKLFVHKEHPQPVSADSHKAASKPTWRGLLLSGPGWLEALEYIGNEFRSFWLNLAIGFILGGMILAAGLQQWWFEIGDGSIFTDALSAFLASVLGIGLFVPPVGNLVVVSNLFKTYTIGYPGVVSFLLVSVLNPLSFSSIVGLVGKKHTLAVALVIFVAAFVTGLLVTAIYALLGFRPGHVPLGRELVDEIIRWLPFTMGTMGGGM